MRRSRRALASLAPALAFAAPALSQTTPPDVIMAPGTYTGDQTHAGRTIIRNGVVELTNGRFTRSPEVIVEDTGTLSVRSFLNPVVPNLLDLRGGVIRAREETGVGALRLGSGTSEAEFEGHPLNVTRLVRNPGATLFLDPSGPINPGTGRAFRIAQTPPQLFGSGATPTRLPVAPWAVALATTTERAFTTYEAGQLRALNPATEYAPGISPTPSNVRLVADTTVAADASVNTLTLNGSTLTLDGGSLTLQGGGLLFNPGTTSAGGIAGTGRLVLPEEGFVHAYRVRGPQNPPAATYTIDVPVSGGMLTKTGNGTLSLTRANTFTGGMAINEGVVDATATSLGTGPIYLAGGTLNVRTPNPRIRNDLVLQSYARPQPQPFFSLTATGTVTLEGTISGDGLLTLNAPTRLLGGAFPFGAYEIQQFRGSLFIGSNLESPQSIVTSGALYGRGVARGIVSAPGITSPGEENNGTGHLIFGTAYFGGSNALVQFDLAGRAGAFSYDRLTVLDALYLDRAFRGSNAADAPELYVRIRDGFTPVPGDSYTLIDNQFSGPVSGIFDGRPEGGEFFAGFTQFRITYAGGDGNDVVVTVVPEPAGAMLVLLPAAAHLLRRGRRGETSVA